MFIVQIIKRGTSEAVYNLETDEVSAYLLHRTHRTRNMLPYCLQYHSEENSHLMFLEIKGNYYFLKIYLFGAAYLRIKIEQKSFQNIRTGKIFP